MSDGNPALAYGSGCHEGGTLDFVPKTFAKHNGSLYDSFLDEVVIFC